MATIKDIAKLAGVSHGTVSNVLNDRGNVSAEKISAVQKAALQLGYQLNAQASSLRAGKSNAAAIVLPNICDEQYHLFYQGLCQQLLTHSQISLDLYLTEDRSNNERVLLKKLASRQYQFIVTVSCLDNANLYYQTLKLPPEDIFFVYRQLADAVTFFNLDFQQAALSIAEQLLQHSYTKIGVFTESLTFPYCKEFIETLTKQLACRQDIQLNVLSTTSIASYQKAFDFFSQDPPDAIVVLSQDKVQHIRTANYFGSTQPCPPIYAIAGNRLQIDPDIHYYQMNYERLGMVVGQCMVDGKRQAKSSVYWDKGFKSEQLCSLFSYSDNAYQLNMLTLPSPSTEALRKLLPHFQRHTGIEVKLSVYQYDELLDMLTNLSQHDYYDILRIDMACIPWLANQIFKPLHEVSPLLPPLLQNYSDTLIEHYTKVDGVDYTIPFDPSVQLMFYRRDLFENIMIRRLFYERCGKELRVPTSFAEFDQISAFFYELNRSGQYDIVMGSSVSTGMPAIIATEYLLRYYALGGRLIHSDNSARLEPKIALQALNQYREHFQYASHLTSGWWEESVAQFEQGKLAMLIVYMNQFTDTVYSQISPNIGYSAVPGGLPLLGGGSLGISRFSQKDQQTTLFFNWLFSEPIAEQIVLLGGSAAHKGIGNNQLISQRYPWIYLADRSSQQGIRESSLPNGERFNLRQAEKIIGQGITNASNNIMSNEETIHYINRRLAQET